MEPQEKLEQLCAITGLEEPAAQNLLDAAGGDLDVAVSLHFNFEDGQTAGGSGAAGSGFGGGAPPYIEGDYEEDEEDEDDEDDEEGFEEEEDDDDDEGEGMPGGPSAPQGGAAGGGDGGAIVPRLRSLFGLLSRLPGFSLLAAVAIRLGSLLWRTGIPRFFGSLLLAPLSAIGLLRGDAAGVPQGAIAIQRFESSFEERYGATHPRFFRGTCAQALQASRRDLRFLLVYLHADSADAATFAQRVLSSALFTHFVDENLTFWVGDVASLEGRRMRQALRVQQLPALVVLAHGDLAPHQGPGGAGGGGGAITQALGSLPGCHALDDDRVVDQLNMILRQYEPLLVAARAERHQLDMDRQMREEQQQEYARALAEDQAREAAEEAERERELLAQQAAEAAIAEQERLEREEEAAAEARIHDRRAKGATLPAEPPQGAADATRVVVRMPDGRRLDRRFPKDCALRVVVDWVESEEPELFDFALVSNYPRKEFGDAEQLATSLDELGLHPSAMFFTKDVSED